MDLKLKQSAEEGFNATTFIVCDESFEVQPFV